MVDLTLFLSVLLWSFCLQPASHCGCGGVFYLYWSCYYPAYPGVAQLRAVCKPCRPGLRSPAGTGRQPRPAPAPGARCPPFCKRVLPSRAWAGNPPSRECARRRPPIAAKPRPSAVPEQGPMLPGTPSPCIRPAASPAAGPPLRGTRGRESGSLLTELRERTRQGESSPSVRGSANPVLFWQRGRGLFVRWIDTL